jgi:aminoglycoside phosphotransferase family enzyme
MQFGQQTSSALVGEADGRYGASDARSTPPLVAALLRPTAYPHPADHIAMHETHISWVFLAGAFAYKVKKPVDLGFVNFATFDRRATDCAEEVRLNRRLCPELYLGVVEIVERDGDYFVGGPGRPIESAVWMRRLPADGMLPAMLARHAVRPSLMRRIARRLAAFHSQAATGPGVDEYGTPATIREIWHGELRPDSALRRTYTDVLGPDADHRVRGVVPIPAVRPLRSTGRDWTHSRRTW